MPDFKRGDVWLADLNPVRGHEQAGRRPVLIVSDELLNNGPARLVMIVLMTGKNRGIAYHVEVQAPEGGVRHTSYIKCEDLRSASVERLKERWGAVTGATLAEVEYRLRLLLKL